MPEAELRDEIRAGVEFYGRSMTTGRAAGVWPQVDASWDPPGDSRHSLAGGVS